MSVKQKSRPRKPKTGDRSTINNGRDTVLESGILRIKCGGGYRIIRK